MEDPFGFFTSSSSLSIWASQPQESCWRTTIGPLMRSPTQVGFPEGSDQLFWADTTFNVTMAPSRTAYLYKREFDSIDRNAFQTTNTSFCLSWDIDSDIWWTHNPEWEVADETDSYYCFHRITNSDEVAYIQLIYENQFHGSCQNQIALRMWSSGWNADMGQLLDSLRSAHLVGRPVQITETPWHYASPDNAGKGNKIASSPACPTEDQNCFFLAISDCPRASSDREDKLEQLEKGSECVYLPINARCGYDQRRWLRHFLIRPQLWIRKLVYDFVKRHIDDDGIIQTPCTAIHVRRSDVILHGKISRKYHGIGEYLNVTSWDPTFQIQQNVLLFTDDQNAIGEAQTLFPHYNWMHINRPRWKADEAGFERQLPSSQPIFEMVVLLSTFRLVQQCDNFVRATTGFADWLEEYGKDTNSSFRVYNLDTMDRSGVVFSSDNSVSKVVSKDYTAMNSIT